MKSSTPLLPLVLAALAGLSCATAPSPAPMAAEAPVAAPVERAFLWEVKSAHAQGGTVYVVGSIHLGRPGELSFPASMEQAFARSDALVVEVDVGAVDQKSLQRFILEQGLLPPEQRLSERLDPETAKLLGPAAERVGLPLAGLERMRPWVVAVTLSVMELQRSGYQTGLGVDRVFLDRARGAKQIIELESAEGQLRMLANLPEPQQDAMLRDQLSRSEHFTQGLEQITEAWKAGDAERMAALVFPDQADREFRPVYEQLFYERNARMAEALGRLLAQPRTWFVVVGAGHVVGPRGLVALLEGQGHRVRQLPKVP
jgi:uncharacterized protein YbaP (TraB family)